MTPDDLDQIHIRDLRLRCIIGVDPDERVAPQDVLIQVTLWTDLQPAGRSDDLDETVNYRTIEERIVAMVEPSQFLLIEAMAESIAEICLADERVAQARVVVDKPGALDHSRSVAVDITRPRRDG